MVRPENSHWRGRRGGTAFVVNVPAAVGSGRYEMDDKGGGGEGDTVRAGSGRLEMAEVDRLLVVDSLSSLSS